MYWLFLGLTLAGDPPTKGTLDMEAMPADHEPEPAPQPSSDPGVELIPGIQNAGLPPMAPETLPPPVTPTEVKPLSGVAPMAAPVPPAPQVLPPPPPPLKTHEGLPPPPPPIEEAGLPPTAEDSD